MNHARDVGPGVAVGFETHFVFYPSRAFLSNGALIELILEPQFKLTAAQLCIANDMRNIEFSTFLHQLFINKRWRAEDESQLIDRSQFLLKGFKSIDRENRSGNAQFASRLDGLLQIFADFSLNVVKGLHV